MQKVEQLGFNISGKANAPTRRMHDVIEELLALPVADRPDILLPLRGENRSVELKKTSRSEFFAQ